MKIPRELRDLFSRLIFALLGIACVIFTIEGFRRREFSVGRGGVTHISMEDAPIKFWIGIVTGILLAGVAFNYTFAKGSDDE